MKQMLRLPALLSLLALAACATPVSTPETAQLVLSPASFSDLPGWGSDNAGDALQAFRQSCTVIQKQDDRKAFGPSPQFGLAGDWKAACAKAAGATDARAFFEQNFTVWEASGDGNPSGLFTGYYEPLLHGSLTRDAAHQTPLRKRPPDLVTVDLGAFRDSLKGQRIAGRVVNGTLRPYENRAAIAAGKLPPQDDSVLVWVDNPIDAFFLEIQGSGRVRLTDGTEMRVGYAAQNGYAYYAVGRELVKRGALAKDDVSLQSIRSWMTTHPAEAQDVMNTNPSYVFFQQLPNGNDGPPGAEGVALTPERSLAVDHSKVAYGVPIFVSAPSGPGLTAPFQRLMVAQDTGGAIVGPVRGDIFFGHGDHAEEMAGQMKASGRWWMLLPKAVRP